MYFTHPRCQQAKVNQFLNETFFFINTRNYIQNIFKYKYENTYHCI
jgi:hypothetical protein